MCGRVEIRKKEAKMKYFGYAVLVFLAYAAFYFFGVSVGLSKGLKECDQIMMMNENPCFPIGEEGWHYIHCDCCGTYIWHNPNIKQEININLERRKSINKPKGE
jgi:hypothetical protein